MQGVTARQGEHATTRGEGQGARDKGQGARRDRVGNCQWSGVCMEGIHGVTSMGGMRAASGMQGTLAGGKYGVSLKTRAGRKYGVS
eukprot:359715-Chlamydomonas_euryale.AAC.8